MEDFHSVQHRIRGPLLRPGPTLADRQTGFGFRTIRASDGGIHGPWSETTRDDFRRSGPPACRCYLLTESDVLDPGSLQPGHRHPGGRRPDQHGKNCFRAARALAPGCL